MTLRSTPLRYALAALLAIAFGVLTGFASAMPVDASAKPEFRRVGTVTRQFVANCHETAAPLPLFDSSKGASTFFLSPLAETLSRSQRPEGADPSAICAMWRARMFAWHGTVELRI